MDFSGWMPVSLVDYPKKIATVVFTSKCNFDCAYCHNPSLKRKQPAIHKQEQIFRFVEKKRKQLDGIVISGGEPSLFEEEVIAFSKRFKAVFHEKYIKVDTNGSNTAFLENGRGIFDMIAMDFKSLRYEEFATTPFETILRSLELTAGYNSHEIRITLYPPYIKRKDFEPIAGLLKEKKICYVALQQYRPIDTISAYPIETVEEFANVLESYNIAVLIR
jgi:pyruvate formate lyase activating enzyme